MRIRCGEPEVEGEGEGKSVVVVEGYGGDDEEDREGEGGEVFGEGCGRLRGLVADRKRRDGCPLEVAWEARKECWVIKEAVNAGSDVSHAYDTNNGLDAGTHGANAFVSDNL